MANFTMESRSKNLPDIQRDWMWELSIPNLNDMTDEIMKDDEDLTVRVRSAVIPSRGNDPIESNFIGMKQFFPGKPTFGHTLAVSIEETEDQIVHRALTAWQDRLFNVNPNDATAGVSSALLKRQLTKTIYLLPYKYNQDKMLKKIRFHNAFIQNVDDVTMDYTGNASVKYTTTFQFDFWTLEDFK